MEYRDLHSEPEYRRVVELEKRIWGYADAEDIVPVPILAVTVKRGGILVGAFESGLMIGFVYSLPAVKYDKPTQWSHMLGVLDEYRGDGVGRRLKLEQRRRTIDMGQDLIEWTFDPMQALNAHLNFRSLGVVAREYAENLYGESSSPLHKGTPTDRFIVEWWIRAPEVVGRLEGHASGLPLDRADIPIVNATAQEGAWLRCVAVRHGLADPRLQVEIPAGFSEMQIAEPALAREWRSATRDIFTSYLAAGYRVIDFALDRSSNRGSYLLER